MINFTRLRHVLAVDQAGSFSAAAETIGITQSALTKSVASVEDELGLALFDRRARGVIATAEGRDFLDRAKRIVGELDLLVSDAKRHQRRDRSLLRIGICPPSMEPFLTIPLAKLVRPRPNLRLHVTALTSERALRFLKRGDFDVLIGPTDLFQGDSQLESAEVGLLSAFPFVRKEHPLAALPAPSLADLSRYPIITPELYRAYAGSIEEIYQPPASDPQEMVSVIDHFPLVAAIVKSSDHLGVVSRVYSQTAGFKRDFVILNLDVFKPFTFSRATVRASAAKPIIETLTNNLREAWNAKMG